MKQSTNNRLAYGAMVVLLAAVVAAVFGRRLYDGLAERRADLAARGWMEPDASLAEVWPYRDQGPQGVRPPQAFNEREQQILVDAQNRIPELRRGSASIQFLDGEGEPLGSGWVVDYELYRHEFLFGETQAGQGGMPSANAISLSSSAPWDEVLRRNEEAREKGLVTLFDSVVRPETDVRIDTVLDKVRKTAERLAGRFDLVSVWSEPVGGWASELGLDREGLLETIARACGVYRAADPQARILLILGEPLFRDDIISGKAFAHQVAEREIECDVLGLRLWYNGIGPQGEGLPGAYLQDIEDALFDYNAVGLPMMITEFGVPEDGTFAPGQTWTAQGRAEFAEAMLIVAMSIPDMEGFFFAAGGESEETSRRLNDLIEMWATKGSGETGGEGRIDIDGFGGAYRASAASPDGEVLHYEFTIKSREKHTMSIQPF